MNHIRLLSIWLFTSCLMSQPLAAPIEVEPITEFPQSVMGRYITDFCLNGDYAYLVESGNVFTILDCSHLPELLVLSRTHFEEEVYDIEVAENIARLFYKPAKSWNNQHEESEGWIEFDISTPSAPLKIASSQGGESQWPRSDHEFEGAKLLLYDENGSNASEPVGQLDIPKTSGDYVLAQSGSLLIAGYGTGERGYHSRFKLLSAGFLIVDLSDPSNPVIHSETEIPGPPTRIRVANDLAFISYGMLLSSSGLLIYDISNPKNPALLGSLGNHIHGNDFVVHGARIYISSNLGYSIASFDISNPAKPVYAGKYTYHIWEPYRIESRGSTIFLEDGWYGLQILDASNPDKLKTIAEYRPIRDPMCKLISGNSAFIVDKNRINKKSQLRIINIANPSQPVWLGFIEFEGDAKEMRLSDSRLKVDITLNGEPKSLALDVSDPLMPKLLDP